MGFLDQFSELPGMLADGAPQGMPVPQPNGGLLSEIQQPPPQQPGPLMGSPQPNIQQPGLLERIRTPDDRTGLSFGEKLYMLGDTATGGDSVSRYQQGRRQDQEKKKQTEQQAASAAKRNAAFKAAYVNGKFDPAAFVSALGDQPVDFSDVASLAHNLKPERPQTFNTRDGLVTMGEDGQPTLAYPTQQKLPTGLRMGENGEPEVDPEYLALQTQLANARAGAVASHRAPPRGHSGGGGGGGLNHLSTQDLLKALGGQ